MKNDYEFFVKGYGLRSWRWEYYKAVDSDNDAVIRTLALGPLTFFLIVVEKDQ